MSAAQEICAVEASGWPTADHFDHLRLGKNLTAELKRWASAEECGGRDFGLVEELGAALEGRFELTSGDDRYEIAAGQAILVPAGAPRQWRALDDGVLYRVACMAGTSA
jgi:hypothetical protein